ncbi:Uncharacterised protein [Paenibacillus thiaminolyticus]|nr:Uncharacterised protein [Paenibacillus thiaminolyticus]
MFEQLAKLHLSPEEYLIIPSIPGVDIKDMTKYDMIVMGGGSLLIPGYLNILHDAVRQQKRVIIWPAAMIACTRSASVPVLLPRAKSCA